MSRCDNRLELTQHEDAMGLRIVDTETELDAGFAALEDMLTRWAGRKTDAWQKGGRDGPKEEGASFAKRDDVYVYIQITRQDAHVGVALTEKDKDILRIGLPRRDPDKQQKRVAMAVDEAGGQFLLVSEDELKSQSIREPFRRLAGAPQLKRATVGDRDYILIGPVSDARTADGLMAIAVLHPEYERFVERVGRGAADSDARDDDLHIYPISLAVQRQHRAQTKVVQALFDRARTAGFQVVELKTGPTIADLALSRGDVSIAFEIRADAELEDFTKGVGQLALLAPKSAGWRRCLALPAPREPIGQKLRSLEPAFEELGLMLLFYDFQGNDVSLWAHFTPTDYPADLRQLFG
jgi:hypothetical protein